MEGLTYKATLIVIAKEYVEVPLFHANTTQEFIDAHRNMIEETLPDVSKVPQDGDRLVIAKIEINGKQVFNQDFEKVSQVSLVKLIQNPLLQGLMNLNLASIGE